MYVHTNRTPGKKAAVLIFQTGDTGEQKRFNSLTLASLQVVFVNAGANTIAEAFQDVEGILC